MNKEKLRDRNLSKMATTVNDNLLAKIYLVKEANFKKIGKFSTK